MTALVAAGVALMVASCGDDASPEPPPGVEVFDDLSREHVEGDVDYDGSPPVGGPHAPVWQNCGFYDEPVPEERAVHSMEHGAVWITYRPDLAEADVERLRELATGDAGAGEGYVLVSQYPDQPAPVVATAWGRQLQLPSASDPPLEQFVAAFVQGPQTPEPGAPCSGGAG
ncbi:MAG: DUF3105 domain-containing protein [Actinomycetota bacterium]|nr:DUF3105 domain-containing protein [Actinomycetota bacterium]